MRRRIRRTRGAKPSAAGIGRDSQVFARNDRNRDTTTGYHGFFERHRTSVQTYSGRHRIRTCDLYGVNVAL